MKNNRLNIVLLIGAMGLLSVSCSKDEPKIVQPVAAFTYVLDGAAKKVTFTNTSTNADIYSWDFGDGSAVSTDASPVHTYAQGGKYAVKLSAVGAVGSTTSEKVDTVTVPIPLNYVKGGTFETGDSKYWTVLHEPQKDADGNLANVKYQFGYTAYKPTNGTGGSLYIFPTNTDIVHPSEEGTLFTQNLGSLDAATYQISSLIKFGGEDSSKVATGFATNYWIQIYLTTVAPVNGTDPDATALQITGWYFGAWTGWQYVIPPLDGLIPNTYLPSNLADKDGKFTLVAGTYYLVIKIGKGGSSTFGNGIAFDQLTLNKLDASGNPVF
jgi:PKD repeat protein